VDLLGEIRGDIS